MTFEDVLESIIGPYAKHKIKIDKSDIGILTSIAKQTSSNIGLTDRQLELVKLKLDLYKSQIPDYIPPTTLRIPLREIDRRHFVTIETKDDNHYIVIRFPFKKKLIDLVEGIRRLYPDFHIKDKQKHYFLLTEKSVYNVVSLAKRFPAFEIDNILLEWHKELDNINANKEKYVPTVKNNKIFNVRDNCKEALINHCGKENTLLFYDRRNLFGIKNFDQEELDRQYNSVSVLTQKIIRRNTNDISISKKEWSLNHLAHSINELHRYPLLVIINNKFALDQLSIIHKTFNGFIENKECSVLFRLDNIDSVGKNFNEYIRDYNLNNPVDSTTKIVYTSKEKLPKPLLESKWRPACVLTMDTMMHSTKISTFMQGCDLNIFFEEEESMIGRYSKGREKV